MTGRKKWRFMKGAVLIALQCFMLCGCGSSRKETAVQESFYTGQEENAAREDGVIQENAAGTGNPVEMPDNKESARAIRLGLVPEELQRDYGRTIKASEMGELTGKMIAGREPALIDEWTATTAVPEDIPLQRAAELLGDAKMNALYDGYFTEENAPWNQEEAECPLTIEETVTIPGPNGTDYTGDRKLGAIIFSYSRCSRLSHLPLMEFDENWDYRGNEPLTREDAILAVVRLYDSFDETPEYITLEEAAERSTITMEQIGAAPELPELRGNELPLWRGVGIDNKAESSFWHGHYTRDYYYEELQYAAEAGFDFFRVMISFTSLQYPDYPEDVGLVNERELEELDQVILFAMEHGIHVQISAFAMPGRYELAGFGNGENYNDGEFYPSEEEWEAFQAWFTMLAKRWRDVPASCLSFELCSEWHPGDQGRLEDFSDHMDRVIAAIREISPERLLMAGFDGDPAAAEVMAEKGIAISYHCYEPREFTYVSQETLAQSGEIPGWPVQDEDGGIWNADRIYEEYIKPFRDIAERYGVGFMVGEWGVCNDAYYEECHPQEEDVEAFYEEMSRCFREKGIPWNHFALAGRNCFVWSGSISGFGREGAEPEELRYEYEDYDFEFKADTRLLEAVMK